MKKKGHSGKKQNWLVISALVFMFMLIPSNVWASAYAKFTVDQYSYEISGISYPLDVAPYIKDGRVFVPLRYVALACEISSKNINYDEPTKTISLKKDGGIAIKLQLGDNNIFVDNQAVPMDVYPEIVNGRLCLPLSYVARALGRQINWDQESMSVQVVMTDYLDEANKDIKNKLYASAADKCSKLIDLSPNDANAYYFKAESQYLNDDFENALTTCSKAIELKPKFADPYMLRANAYYKIFLLAGGKGSTDNIFREADKAIEVSDNQAVAYTQRAILNNKLKKYSDAIDDSNKAIELNPKYYEAYRQRVTAYYYKEGQIKGVSELEAMLKIFPNDEWATDNLNRLKSVLHLFPKPTDSQNNPSIQLDD